MSTYINNLGNQLLHHSGDLFLLEHESKKGWFMFDINESDNMTEFLWCDDPQICLKWTKEADASEFLTDIGISKRNISVTKIQIKIE